MKCYGFGWEWHKPLPVNSKTNEFTKKWNLHWNAINICYLSHSEYLWYKILMSEQIWYFWPQELPVEHMVVLQSNKNTWEK